MISFGLAKWENVLCSLFTKDGYVQSNWSGTALQNQSQTTKFSDNAVRDGVWALRDFVANETRENLINLSEQRSNSVSTCKICILLPTIIVLSTKYSFFNQYLILLLIRVDATRFSKSKAAKTPESTLICCVQMREKPQSYLVSIWTINLLCQCLKIVVME